MKVTLFILRQSAFLTSPVGAVGVMADIIKLEDSSCYLEELVKSPSFTGERESCNAGRIIWL